LRIKLNAVLILKKQCRECASLRDAGAALYASYEAAQADLAIMYNFGPEFPIKRREVEQLKRQLRQAYKNTRTHRNQVHRGQP
jgi:hypothetical protein